MNIIMYFEIHSSVRTLVLEMPEVYMGISDYQYSFTPTYCNTLSTLLYDEAARAERGRITALQQQENKK